MKKVQRSEILDHVTYGEQREKLRPQILEVKALRRIHVGDALTFLFENHQTVRDQVQEMVRVERMVREADIQHELDTYNELLGDDGELGCTMLIEIEDPQKRAVCLREWLALPEHVFVVLDDGATVSARFDGRQNDGDRLSSVQFVKFATGGRTPVAVRVTHPGCAGETRLTEAQRAALAADLA